MTNRVIAAVLVCIISFFTCHHASSAETDEWTLLFYLDGDNSIESFALVDFLEMASVGSSDDVNIVVLLDRIDFVGDGDSTQFGNWSDARRGLVEKNDQPDTSWGESIGEVNMGDPQTLVDFVTWGMQEYPAQRYGVVLWDSGDGWSKNRTTQEKAVCRDQTSDLDALQMHELRSAFEDIADGVGAPPDLIGFDAGLMGMAEVAYQLKDSAAVMVAPQEEIGNDGWDYTSFLSDLVTTPNVNAATLGTSIVDTYNDFYLQFYGYGMPLSAIDLTAIDSLGTSISGLGQTLSTKWRTDGAACIAAAQDVMTAIDSAVIHERHGRFWPGANGLSIYFPILSSAYDLSYGASTNPFAAATGWATFLADFFSSMRNSWVFDASNDTQFFADVSIVDLYDFCLAIHFFAPDDMSVTPNDVLFVEGPVGGPFNPSCTEYTVTNTGNATLNWTIETNVNWLNLSSAKLGGPLGAGASANIEVCLNSRANSLSQGFHLGAAIFTNIQTGAMRAMHVSVAVDVPDYFTEEFDAGQFDLAHKTLTFVPDASTSGYTACISPATSFPSDTSTAALLQLGNATTTRLELPLGTAVPLYGWNYAAFNLSDDGYLFFDPGDATKQEALEEHFSIPGIDMLFMDLNPSAGGAVSTSILDDRLVISFENVPDINLTGLVSFQVEIFFAGKITITWLNMTVTNPATLVGLSPGGGTPGDYQESDLSGYDSCGGIPIGNADLNGDGFVNASDVQLVINGALGIDIGIANADVNRDGTVNASDVQLVINAALGL